MQAADINSLTHKDSDDAPQFKDAARSISTIAETFCIPSHHIAFVYFPQNDMDRSARLTTEHLAKLVGSRSVRDWKSWGGLSAFGTRTVNGLLQGQLLVAIGQQEFVTNTLHVAGASNSATEVSPLQPFFFQLVALRRFLRRPAYDLTLVRAL